MQLLVVMVYYYYILYYNILINSDAVIWVLDELLNASICQISPQILNSKWEVKEKCVFTNSTNVSQLWNLKLPQRKQTSRTEPDRAVVRGILWNHHYHKIIRNVLKQLLLQTRQWLLFKWITLRILHYSYRSTIRSEKRRERKLE